MERPGGKVWTHKRRKLTSVTSPPSTHDSECGPTFPLHTQSRQRKLFVNPPSFKTPSGPLLGPNWNPQGKHQGEGAAHTLGGTLRQELGSVPFGPPFVRECAQQHESPKSSSLDKGFGEQGKRHASHLLSVPHSALFSLQRVHSCIKEAFRSRCCCVCFFF